METGDVEQRVVGPGVNIDSLAAVLEGVLEEHGEEDTKERRCEDTALFHSAADGLGYCTIEADCAVHFLVEAGVGGSQSTAVA